MVCGYSAREDNVGQRHGRAGCSKIGLRNSNHKRHPLWAPLTTNELEELLRENEARVGKYQPKEEEGEALVDEGLQELDDGYDNNEEDEDWSILCGK